MAELADAHDSKSCEVTPRVGSTPTSGTNGAVVKRDHTTMALSSHGFDSRQLHQFTRTREGELTLHFNVVEM